MATVLADIERLAVPGTVIPKPRARGDNIVKGWGRRRAQRALIYTIPNHGHHDRPHEKGITTSEWLQAYDQLSNAGNFSRTWFKRFMPACDKEGSCNFTTIGGIFVLLGYATHEPSVYRLTHAVGRQPSQ